MNKVIEKRRIIAKEKKSAIVKCRLCGKYFDEKDMSDEHYPAHSVGNDDIVALDIMKMIDLFESKNLRQEMVDRISSGEKIENITEETFDNELSETIYPKGRTAKTLCRNCNMFLGKYDEAYLKFFNAGGHPKKVRGFQNQTKYQIIKAIYAKFLSVPEAIKEEFDFIDFVRNKSCEKYDGEWKLYFIKRDYSTDLMGLKDIGTGKVTFNEGVVYELSDDKFIFNLMNFEKHPNFEMTNIFDILKKDYVLTVGVDEYGGYHGQILMSRLFSQMHNENT